MRKMIFLLLSLLITGCSMDASLQQITASTIVIKSLDGLGITGLAAGSKQTATASGGGGNTYTVESSVGTAGSGSMNQATTDGSYKVFSSVQGVLSSESN